MLTIQDGSSKRPDEQVHNNLMDDELDLDCENDISIESYGDLRWLHV